MEIRWLGEAELTFNPIPLSVCPAGKTVQSTGDDIGEMYKNPVAPGEVPVKSTGEDIGEVVRNQSLDHTIKPCHWTRPFTPLSGQFRRKRV